MGEVLRRRHREPPPFRRGRGTTKWWRGRCRGLDRRAVPRHAHRKNRDGDEHARAEAMNPRILVLTMCTFAFGSAAFIFAGLLEKMAADLGVSTAVAGQLQT